MSSQPFKLSIVTIAYQDPTGLNATLESCMAIGNLAEVEWEHIIVDSSPNDHKAIRTDPRFQTKTWLVQEPLGIYAALNLGTQTCRHEFVIHLNSGDRIFDVNALLSSLKALNAQPQAYFSIAPVKLMKKTRFIRMGRPLPSLQENLIGKDLVWHQGTIFRRRVFEQFGLFDESYRLSGDYELFVRLANSNCPYISLDDAYVEFEVGGRSSQNIKLALKETQRAFHNLKTLPHERISGILHLLYNRARVEFAQPILKALGIYQPIHDLIENLKKKIPGD